MRIKILQGYLLTASILAFCTPIFASGLAPFYTVNNSIITQYIVKIKTGYGVDAVEKDLKSLPQYRISGNRVKVLQKIHHVLRALVVEAGYDELKMIRQLPGVEYVEEDAIVWRWTSDTWGLDRIDQRDLPTDGHFKPKGTGAGVNIYIVDTGINPIHSDVNGRAENVYNFEDGDVRDFDVPSGGDGSDCNGHGSHCSGAAAGTTFGVASQARIYGVRVLNCFGTGSQSKLIKGLDWIAANVMHPAVASLSLGSSASRSVDEAVRNLIQSGITTTVAAGSSWVDACSFSPARVEEALTVSATNPKDMQLHSSNFGRCVDIFAPGADIQGIGHESNDSITVQSGTSTACAYVAGAAAIELGLNPSLAPSQVKKNIMSNGSRDRLNLQEANVETCNLLLYVG